MKCDPNDAAFSLPGWTDLHGEFIYPVSGLTKREEFAKAAMQGILSNSEFGPNIPARAFASWAVEQADALIAELNKEQT